MTTFLMGFGVFALSTLGLAIGVLMSRAPIKGSCGGIACGVPDGCSACPKAHKKGTEL